jgi:Zn-dependent alcohol dehydrogenase
MIVGVDINSKKFEMASQFGATHCISPDTAEGGDVKKWLMEQ